MHVARRRAGFSLIEVMIVIVILAIITAVAIPQFGDALARSRRARMEANVQLLRKAIERYRFDHDGKQPAYGLDMPGLIKRTNKAGVVGTGAEHVYGPYLMGEMPINPMNGYNIVFPTAVAPPPDPSGVVGWIYHWPTGQIWAGERIIAGCP